MAHADAAIARHHHPRLPVERSQILGDHRVTNHAGVFVRDDADVEIDFSDALGAGDGVEALTDVLWKLRQASDLNISAAADVVERLLDACRIRPLPIGYEDFEVRVPGQVRVGVRGDVHPARPRRLDERDHFRRFAPHANCSQFDVRDLHRELRLLANRNRLVDGLERAIRFVADVRDVEAAVARSHARQRHELRRRCVATDLVLESRREADGAFSTGLVDERHHFRDLSRRRLASKIVAHHRSPDGGMPDEHRDVDRRRLRSASREVVTNRQRRAAVLTQENGSDALGHLRVGLGIRVQPVG